MDVERYKKLLCFFMIFYLFFTIYLFFRSYDIQTTSNHYVAVARFLPEYYDDYAKEMTFIPAHVLNIILIKCFYDILKSVSDRFVVVDAFYLLSSLFGALGISFFYLFLEQQLIRRSIAILSSVLLGLSYHYFSFSSASVNGTLFVFSVIFTIYSFFKVFDSNLSARSKGLIFGLLFTFSWLIYANAMLIPSIILIVAISHMSLKDKFSFLFIYLFVTSLLLFSIFTLSAYRVAPTSDIKSFVETAWVYSRYCFFVHPAVSGDFFDLNKITNIFTNLTRVIIGGFTLDIVSDRRLFYGVSLLIWGIIIKNCIYDFKRFNRINIVLIVFFLFLFCYLVKGLGPHYLSKFYLPFNFIFCYFLARELSFVRDIRAGKVLFPLLSLVLVGLSVFILLVNPRYPSYRGSDSYRKVPFGYFTANYLNYIRYNLPPNSFIIVNEFYQDSPGREFSINVVALTDIYAREKHKVISQNLLFGWHGITHTKDVENILENTYYLPSIHEEGEVMAVHGHVVYAERDGFIECYIFEFRKFIPYIPEPKASIFKASNIYKGIALLVDNNFTKLNKYILYDTKNISFGKDRLNSEDARSGIIWKIPVEFFLTRGIINFKAINSAEDKPLIGISIDGKNWKVQHHTKRDKWVEYNIDISELVKENQSNTLYIKCFPGENAYQRIKGLKIYLKRPVPDVSNVPD